MCFHCSHKAQTRGSALKALWLFSIKLVMFKYTGLCWSITITLDILFAQQLPFGAIAIAMLCTCAFPRKIVPGPCVLLFDEGRLNITTLHAEGDTWATSRIVKSPEYWTQGQQICSWIREPDRTEHTAQELRWYFTSRLQEIVVTKLFFRWSSRSVCRGELLSVALTLHPGNSQTEGKEEKLWAQMKMLDKIHFGNEDNSAVLVCPEYLTPNTMVSIT